jgi:hypothetical protein
MHKSPQTTQGSGAPSSASLYRQLQAANEAKAAIKAQIKTQLPIVARTSFIVTTVVYFLLTQVKVIDISTSSSGTTILSTCFSTAVVCHIRTFISNEIVILYCMYDMYCGVCSLKVGYF